MNGLEVDSDSGRLRGADWRPSPNSDERPADARLELIVIHGISLPPGQFGGGWIDDLFMNRLDPDAHPYFAGIAHRRVSAHLLIRRDGELLQYVSFDRRAWHAGESSWCGRPRCNDFSIGVELEGADDVPYEEIQYDRAAAAIDALCRAYPTLGRERLAGHSDISPGRKTDPGLSFDWTRLKQRLALIAGSEHRAV